MHLRRAFGCDSCRLSQNSNCFRKYRFHLECPLLVLCWTFWVLCALRREYRALENLSHETNRKTFPHPSPARCGESARRSYIESFHGDLMRCNSHMTRFQSECRCSWCSHSQRGLAAFYSSFCAYHRCYATVKCRAKNVWVKCKI